MKSTKQMTRNHGKNSMVQQALNSSRSKSGKCGHWNGHEEGWMNWELEEGWIVIIIYFFMFISQSIYNGDDQSHTRSGANHGTIAAYSIG